jgi:uncharacterized coiled-coil protein SlyX
MSVKQKPKSIGQSIADLETQLTFYKQAGDKLQCDKIRAIIKRLENDQKKSKDKK